MKSDRLRTLVTALGAATLAATEEVRAAEANPVAAATVEAKLVAMAISPSTASTPATWPWPIAPS